MKQIKYTYLTKKKTKAIFWTGCIIGGLLWSFSSWYNKMIAADPLVEGLSYLGAMLLSSTIAFFVGMLCKVKE